MSIRTDLEVHVDPVFGDLIHEYYSAAA
jgi:hypothetical protein